MWFSFAVQTKLSERWWPRAQKLEIYINTKFKKSQAKLCFLPHHTPWQPGDKISRQKGDMADAV